MGRAYGVGVGREGEEPVDWDAVEGVVWRHVEVVGGMLIALFELRAANLQVGGCVLVYFLYVGVCLFRQLLGVLACGALAWSGRSP